MLDRSVEGVPAPGFGVSRKRVKDAGLTVDPASRSEVEEQLVIGGRTTVIPATRLWGWMKIG